MCRRTASADYSQPGADSQQAERDRRLGQSSEELQHCRRRLETSQIGRHAGQGRQNQWVPRQFAKQAGIAVSCQHPDGGHVRKGHHGSDHNPHRSDSRHTMERSSHRQADVGIETKGALVLGCKGNRRDPEQACSEPQQHARSHRSAGHAYHRRRGRPVDARLDQPAEQQGREQHVVNQFLQTAPEMVAQMQQAAQTRAEQDQGKIRKKGESDRELDMHA